MKFYTNNNAQISIEEILSWPTVKAVKTASVFAVVADEETRVITYTPDGLIETTNFAHPGDYIVTKCDSTNKVIVDSYGHTNSWVIRAEVFNNLYEPSMNKSAATSIYKPKYEEKTFVIVQKELSFTASWGEKMIALPKDYLNVTDINDIIRIDAQSFEETYKIIE